MVSTSAAESSSTMKRHLNWLELPDELMANIIQRLGTVEILRSVWKVCTTWREICKDPAMWKVINVDALDTCLFNHYLEMLTMKAIDLSCGELIDISINGFGTDDLLNYILLRSDKLNRLCLKNCEDITCNGLTRAVKWLSKLEKLHLSHSYLTLEGIKIIGQNCPQLKSFAINQEFEEPQNDDEALTIANNMHELRHLQVIGNSMTNDGLKAILNGCPHLESLDVRMCFSLNLSKKFEKLCVELLKDFKGPNESLENSGFHHLRHEYNEFDDMYLSEHSDVDEPFEFDFYEDDGFFLVASTV